MLPKIGVDIVYIPKLAKKLENEAFIKKVFHSSELCDSKESLAGRFAAKEAFFKAIGKKVDWLDIEVEKCKAGKPSLRISNEIKSKNKIEAVDVSISHENEYAMAAVIIK